MYCYEWFIVVHGYFIYQLNLSIYWSIKMFPIRKFLFFKITILKEYFQLVVYLKAITKTGYIQNKRKWGRVNYKIILRSGLSRIKVEALHFGEIVFNLYPF